MFHRVIRHPQRRKPSYSVGGDLVDAVTEAGHKLLDWWSGSAVPTKVANFLKSHGEEKIETLKVGRVPIYKTLDLAVDIISGGKFGQIKKQVGYDKFFHLFVVINEKWVLEKNELFNVKSYSKQAEEEDMAVPVKGDLTISEFMRKASEGDEKGFYRDYDAFGANCQAMVLRLLSKNHLLTPAIQSFVKQDVEAFVKEMKPTQETAKTITNTASLVNRLLQLVSGGRLSFAHGTHDMSLNRGNKRRYVLRGIRRKAFI